MTVLLCTLQKDSVRQIEVIIPFHLATTAITIIIVIVGTVNTRMLHFLYQKNLRSVRNCQRQRDDDEKKRQE